jgi:hypothetical protein
MGDAIWDGMEGPLYGGGLTFQPEPVPIDTYAPSYAAVVRSPPWQRTSLCDEIRAGVDQGILSKWARALDNPSASKYPWLDARWLAATSCSKCNLPLYVLDVMTERWMLQSDHVMHGGAARYEPLPSFVNVESIHARMDSSHPLHPIEIRKDTPMEIGDYRANLETTMTQAAAALARLDATPNPADYPDGTVLYVRRQFKNLGGVYEYAYLKASNGYWYGTGHVSVTDDGLRHSLMRDDVREISVATAWEILAGEPADADEFEDED